jgi:cholesterol oxidase-like protein
LQRLGHHQSRKPQQLSLQEAAASSRCFSAIIPSSASRSWCLMTWLAGLNISEELAILAGRIVQGEGALTPFFGQTAYNVTAAGLIASLSGDNWGRSKNLLLCVKPTTLRGTTNGYAILTRRGDIQRVVSEFFSFYQSRHAAYQAQDRYPINLSREIRITGLDGRVSSVGMTQGLAR